MALVRDSKGNLYGTTYRGGASGAGVVFKVDASGHETVLYTFTGGADGGNPVRSCQSSTRKATSTGLPTQGGTSGAGVVFKVDPSGHETVLYTFTGGNDGGYPPHGVIRDSARQPLRDD